MAFEFLLPNDWLNLASFIFEKRETIHKIRLLEEKTVEILEYGKNNDKY